MATYEDLDHDIHVQVLGRSEEQAMQRYSANSIAALTVLDHLKAQGWWATIRVRPFGYEVQLVSEESTGRTGIQLVAETVYWQHERLCAYAPTLPAAICLAALELADAGLLGA